MTGMQNAGVTRRTSPQPCSAAAGAQALGAIAQVAGACLLPPFARSVSAQELMCAFCHVCPESTPKRSARQC